MFQFRKAEQRGHADHGWLNAYHTFSFANYYDPRHMGFRSLRVMNEDRVAPGQGFPTHGHADMEIVTYVLEGALEHRDSMGNGEVLRPGEFQHMSAGTGVRHSEFNPSMSEPVHLYQIWLLPERQGLEPSYDQRDFSALDRRGQWRVVASPDGRDGSLVLHQDVQIMLAEFEPGQKVTRGFGARRFGWLQVLRGAVQLGEEKLVAGDGVAVSEESALTIAGVEPAEVMLFDLN